MLQVLLPNIRKLFIPDDGYVMFDCDLSGADAQVVAWESGDEDLKAAFRAGLDVHSKNAEDMWGTAFTSLPGTVESGPKKKKRQSCKHAVHACNYLATPRAMSVHPAIGWTVHECDRFQKRWFAIHPAIKKWHERVMRQLDTNKTIANAYGYRRVYFDRQDECAPEAVAWVPQSTVALVTFYGAERLERNFCQPTPIVDLLRTPNRNVDILLQNHDSLVFQIPKAQAHRIEDVRKLLSVSVPYPDELVIPWGIKCSEVSWGDCKEVKR